MHRNDRLVTGETLATIRKMEEELWIAETRFDRELMEQYFAPDFFEFGRSGRTYSRDEMIFDEEEKQEINATLPLGNFSARYLTDDVIQVTYISELNWEGEILRGNRSSVWSMDNGRWRLRFHQGTPVEEQS